VPFVAGAAFGALAVCRRLTAIHPAVAVAVGAAVALLLAALRLAGLDRGGLLSMTLMLAMALVLVMTLVLGDRRGLGGGGRGDDEHRGGEKIFHGLVSLRIDCASFLR
jgi:hypothetical protein